MDSRTKKTNNKKRQVLKKACFQREPVPFFEDTTNATKITAKLPHQYN